MSKKKRTDEIAFMFSNEHAERSCENYAASPAFKQLRRQRNGKETDYLGY